MAGPRVVPGTQEQALREYLVGPSFMTLAKPLTPLCLSFLISEM